MGRNYRRYRGVNISGLILGFSANSADMTNSMRALQSTNRNLLAVASVLFPLPAIFAQAAPAVPVVPASVPAGHSDASAVEATAHLGLIFYGDLRLRSEDDFDSHTTASLIRPARNRGRIRLRGGFDRHFSEAWSAGFRLRTGNTGSQQSPLLTFAGDDGVRDAPAVVADRYFVQFADRGFTAWAGRNATPFWHQNELFWDDDVTPTGLAVTYRAAALKGSITATAGAFYLPDGGYRLNGKMLAGQVVYMMKRKNAHFTFASGLHYLNGRKGAIYLRDGNGARNYAIGVESVQWTLFTDRVPVTFGADLFHNFFDYNTAEAAPFPATANNQNLGYALSLQGGQLKKRNDWLLGFTYAHIERFALNASYAQDDWVRFGTGIQTAASDFKGVELRSGYGCSGNLSLQARLYLVHAIATAQDGRRFRMDLNWKF